MLAKNGETKKYDVDQTSKYNLSCASVAYCIQFSSTFDGLLARASFMAAIKPTRIIQFRYQIAICIKNELVAWGSRRMIQKEKTEIRFINHVISI